jgi:hypothetical protein
MLAETCFNYEAEIAAIEGALHHPKPRFDETPTKSHNIVVFPDSLFTLHALEIAGQGKREIEQIIIYTTQLMKTYNKKVVMQWIPGH